MIPYAGGARLENQLINPRNLHGIRPHCFHPGTYPLPSNNPCPSGHRQALLQLVFRAVLPVRVGLWPGRLVLRVLPQQQPLSELRAYTPPIDPDSSSHPSPRCGSGATSGIGGCTAIAYARTVNISLRGALLVRLTTNWKTLVLDRAVPPGSP
jgi:hypothetical protein